MTKRMVRKCEYAACSKYGQIVGNYVACPECGSLTVEEEDKRQKIWIVAGLVLILLASMLYWFSRPPKFDPPDEIIGNAMTILQADCKYLEDTRPDIIKGTISDLDSFRRAVFLYGQKKYEEAIPYFDKVIDLDKRDPLAAILRENCKVLMSKRQYVELAVSGPFTGEDSQKGSFILLGIAYAQEQINQKGGVLGRRVVVCLADDQGNVNQAKIVAEELTKRKSVVAVIGHVLSSTMLAAAPVYEEGKLVCISPSATNPEISKLGNYIFRVCPDDNAQGKKMVELVKKKGAKSLALVSIPSEKYSNGLAEVIKNQIGSTADLAIGNYSAKEGQTDFSEIVANIENAKADAVIFLGKDIDAAFFATELRKRNVNAIIEVGDAGYTLEFLNKAGVNAEGVYSTSFYHADAQRAYQKEFTEGFLSRFNGGVPNARTALAYDSVYVVVKAAEQSQKLNREGVREGTIGLSFLGATGRIIFDANGDVVDKTIETLRVKNGRFTVD